MISGGKRYPLYLILFIRVGYPAIKNPASLERRDNPASLREQTMAIYRRSRHEQRVMEVMADISLPGNGARAYRANCDLRIDGINSVAEADHQLVVSLGVM